jgi:membrane protease YdiL (CAAX protease family)
VLAAITKGVPWNLMFDPNENPLAAEAPGDLPGSAPTVPLDPAVIVPAQPSFPAWSARDVLAITVFAFLCVFLFMVLAVFASGVLAGDRNVSMTELARNARFIRAVLVGQAAAYPVVWACMFLVVRSRTREPFGQAIQWNWPGLYAPAFFIGGIVLALAIDVMSRYLPIPKSLPINDLFTDRTNAYLIAAFGVALAPALEELFFRGLLYPVLRRATGWFIAVLLTGLAFAALHGAQLGYAWAAMLPIFVVGVVFTVVRQWRNSVAATFLMHCGYNFSLFALLWLASDHYRHLEKVAN